MQSTLSLTLDLTAKKGFFTDTTDYNALGVDLNTLGATGSVAVYFQGDVVGSPLAINLAGGGTTTPLFDLELDVNGEVANGTYSAVYTVDFGFVGATLLLAPDQVIVQSLGTNYQGFSAGAEITVSVYIPGGATITGAQDVGGDLYVTIDQSVSSTAFAIPTNITVTQQNGFSWVYAGCNLVEAKSGLVADCDYGDFGTFTVTNETDTTGITITSLSVDINYPSWTNEPVITETSLPYTNNQLATGTYSVTLTLEIQKVQNDGLIITYTSESIQEFKVSCIGSLCGLNDCLENLRKAHEAELLKNKISKYQVYVDNILIYYTEAQSYKSCGQMDEYRATVAKLEAQLDASGCDCGCCDEDQYKWVQNTSPAASNIMQQLVALQNDVTVIQGDITTIQGDITTIQNDAIFTADNGLTESSNNVSLGGPLNANTQINAGNLFSLDILKTSTTNSAAYGLTLTTTKTGGVGGNGLGAGIQFNVEKSTGSNVVTAGIASTLTDAVSGEGNIEMIVSNGFGFNTNMEILGSGGIVMNSYGSGTFTGTPTYNLAVDSTGNVIEVAGGGITTASNGLTELSGDVKLGGTLTENTTIETNGNELIIHSGVPHIDKFEIDGVNFNITRDSDISYNVEQPNKITTNVYRNTSNSLITSQVKNILNESATSPGNSWGDAEEIWLDTGNSGVPALNLASKEAVAWAFNSGINKETKKTFYLQKDVGNVGSLNDVFTLYGSGSVRFNDYGSGTFTGIPAYTLGVTLTGSVIEVAEPLVYVARITQTGTSAPTETVIVNTTGTTFSWSYLLAGIYRVTAASAVLTTDKTAIYVTPSGANPYIMLAGVSNTTQCVITSSSGFSGYNDNLINGAIVKIEIYP